MIELSAIRDLVAIFGVIAGFSYYVLTVRATRKNQRQQLETRQAQLFMTLYETYRSTEFRKQWTAIINQEYTDFNDFWEKYGLENNPEAWANWQSVASFFHGIGILVKKGIVEPSLLDELISPNVFFAWVIMGPNVKGFQAWAEQGGGEMINRFKDYEEHGLSRLYKSWSGFEYLYETLREREEKQLAIKQKKTLT